VRIGLIVIQAIGALSIAPYPFVLLANVMSIAAEGQTLVGAIPYILLTIYPAVWIGLYVLAWRSMSGGATGGATGVAFALSTIPLLFCLWGAVWFFRDEKSVAAHYSKAAEETRAQVEPINPVLWAVMCAGGPNRIFGAPPVSVEQALKTIQANPPLVNVPVPPYGTPLNSALLNLAIRADGSLGNDTREASGRQQDLIRVVRALVSYGARLSADERTNLWRSWQLRRAMFDGPVTSAAENPLVGESSRGKTAPVSCRFVPRSCRSSISPRACTELPCTRLL
jgi:hypothetical protein